MDMHRSGTPMAGDDEATVRLPKDRLTLLFLVMLVTAAGNTAMQSVMPSIGTRLRVPDFWISLAYSWSAVLWMTMAPFWARRSDRRGRKAMMAIGLSGFTLSFALCGLILMGGCMGCSGPLRRCCCSPRHARFTAALARPLRLQSRPMSPVAPGGPSGRRHLA
ncbi:hypothetical protein [Novosphingobium sp. Gsoil 351]|uniref:hypothetical protein n=1 Tax=Novosphingobium sp. Gsoil 351 TaxID=2675225 RepID=UPI001E5465AD|nr:hypothetical protein [Novosphingobium sp. Gsoil 351]